LLSKESFHDQFLVPQRQADVSRAPFALSMTWILAADDAPAKLAIRLPADATLWIGDYQTKQSGSNREFNTPPLAAGKTFVYNLKATWNEDGKPVTAERKVEVRAGQTASVDFTKAVAATGKSRAFLFTYRATVNGLQPGQTARIWLPVPPSNEDQDASIASTKFPAGVDGQVAKEPKYGNQSCMSKPKRITRALFPSK